MLRGQCLAVQPVASGQPRRPGRELLHRVTCRRQETWTCRTCTAHRVQGVANSVGTPYGPAFQSYTPAALSAIGQVQQGATLFRIGTLGQSQAAEAQFWSLQNPLTTPNYPGLYGIPPENVTNANFVETAILQPGSPFITRPAPAVGTNPRGGIEVVVPSGGVRMRSFGTQGTH